MEMSGQSKEVWNRSETVGKQLYLLILHLYRIYMEINERPVQRGLKQVWNRLKL